MAEAVHGAEASQLDVPDEDAALPAMPQPPYLRVTDTLQRIVSLKEQRPDVLCSARGAESRTGVTTSTLPFSREMPPSVRMAQDKYHDCILCRDPGMAQIKEPAQKALREARGRVLEDVFPPVRYFSARLYLRRKTSVHSLCCSWARWFAGDRWYIFGACVRRHVAVCAYAVACLPAAMRNQKQLQSSTLS